MKNIKNILLLVLIVVYAILGYKFYQEKFLFNTVRAFGPLKVTFPDTPLFNEQNWFPGKSVTKSITVENTDSFPHTVLIKPANSENSLADSLLIVILVQGAPIYQRNLPDFFKEKDINLFTLNGHQQQTFDITLTMREDAGDEFQGQTTSFDLVAGIETSTLNTIPTIPPFPTFKLIPTIASFPTIRPRSVNIVP